MRAGMLTALPNDWCLNSESSNVTRINMSESITRSPVGRVFTAIF